MHGTIAVTDHDWYDQLLAAGPLDEVNFWKPSARRVFRADPTSPFLFKLKAPHNAICGFGWFTGYFALPIWLAWDAFGMRNGCRDLQTMRARIAAIRERIGFEAHPEAHRIGCITIGSPVFFERDTWIRQPADWPARTVGDKKYDLSVGEGARVWQECMAHTRRVPLSGSSYPSRVAEAAPRWGREVLMRPRLGQGTFRIAVADAYGWSCAATGEHSLPALDAAHIKPLAEAGPSIVNNGLLLRADLHRLFDKGYVSVGEDRRLLVGARLKQDFNNGRTYYPLHGMELREPSMPALRPDPDFLRWHRDNIFLG